MTLPPFSRRISQLEEKLGCKLFIRKSNGVTLTQQGRFLYVKLKPVYSLLCGLENENLNPSDDNIIRIASNLMYENIVHLMKNNSVNFDFSLQPLTALERSLYNSTIDIAISTKRFSVETGLKRHKLENDGLVFIAPPTSKNSIESLINTLPFIWCDVINDESIKAKTSLLLKKTFSAVNFSSSCDLISCALKVGQGSGVSIIPKSLTDCSTTSGLRIIDCNLEGICRYLYYTNETMMSNKFKNISKILTTYKYYDLQ